MSLQALKDRIAGNSRGGKIGGKAKVKKGLAALPPERRREIAAMGGRKSKRGPVKKIEVGHDTAL